MKLARRPPRKARIEIVPLIDTVFFLLVFFMMASLSMAVYRGLPVHLPRAASARTASPENATVTVDQAGRLSLNRAPATAAEIGAQLRRLHEAHPDLTVIVSADEGVVHGRVVEVFDEVRGAGIARLAIAVNPDRMRAR